MMPAVAYCPSKMGVLTALGMLHSALTRKPQIHCNGPKSVANSVKNSLMPDERRRFDCDLMFFNQRRYVNDVKAHICFTKKPLNSYKQKHL
jgi:hypothetical protein